MNQQQPQQGYPANSYNPNMPQQGNQQPFYGQQAPQGRPGFQQPMNGAQFPGNSQAQAPQAQAPQGKGTGKNKAKKAKKKKGGSLVGWIIAGIFLMIGLAIAGGFIGYNTAINARKAEFSRRSMMAAAEQYQLALVDIEQGKYANAKTRLDYVISIDQNYPGAAETYQQVILALYPTASPTPMMTATPAPTPTTDTRGEEEMFQHIQQSMYAQNWEAAIEQIEALRNRNISFRGFEVDSMYYIALLKYGVQQIQAGNLENGVYKITLAEALGPIDANSNSMRDAARSYLAGAGFWEINWERALEYYSNAAQVYPNLRDNATGLTANQRFGLASFHVAEAYVASQDYCGAIPYYEQGLPAAGTEDYQLTATAVYLVCYPPQEEEAPTSESPETPEEGTGEEPVEEEVVEEWEEEVFE